jgi:hypothetical protein
VCLWSVGRAVHFSIDLAFLLHLLAVGISDYVRIATRASYPNWRLRWAMKTTREKEFAYWREACPLTLDNNCVFIAISVL